MGTQWLSSGLGTLATALSSPQQYGEHQGWGALLLRTSIIYAALNLNTAFASQISLTEMTFPLCHLVTARVFLCRILQTHLMQEVSYTSDKVLS